MDLLEVASRFERDTALHELAVMHDDGLYRHIRCKNPATGYMHSFDLTTWPGHLAFTGDMGDWIISRPPDIDMLAFLRASGARGINPGYWATKVRAGRTREFSELRFKAWVAEQVAEAMLDRPGGYPWDKIKKSIQDEILDAVYDTSTAIEAIEDWNRWHNDDGDFRFSTDDLGHGWDDFRYHYLWACHGIRWAISSYDVEVGAR